MGVVFSYQFDVNGGFEGLWIYQRDRIQPRETEGGCCSTVGVRFFK